MLYINRRMLDDDPPAGGGGASDPDPEPTPETPEYGYARDLDDIEAAAEGDLDVTELTENALRETDNDHTEVGDGTGDASKIYNHDMILDITLGRHAAVKAAKDAYDDEARETATESIVGE